MGFHHQKEISYVIIWGLKSESGTGFCSVLSVRRAGANDLPSLGLTVGIYKVKRIKLLASNRIKLERIAWTLEQCLVLLFTENPAGPFKKREARQRWQVYKKDMLDRRSV